MKSEQINELATALAKAQSQMIPAKKDAANPHLNSKYATLDSIINSARKPLADNGLSFVQIMEQGADGLMLQTCLMHSSGQWMQGEVLVTASAGNRGINEVQALGSALTYYKRYALSAMLGISVAEEDDDGHGAAKQKPQQKQATQQKPVANNGNTSTPKKQELTGFPAIVSEVNKKIGQEYYTLTTAQETCKRVVPDFKMPSSNDAEGLAEVKQVLLDDAEYNTSQL